jgi:Fe-S-cluster containining protein
MSKRQHEKENSWPCKMCGSCCTIMPMSEQLIDRFRDHFQRPVIEEQVFSANDGLMYIKIITPDKKCIFLKTDNKCAIYENRPEICKKFGRKAGNLECVWISPSGRIRSISQVSRIMERKLRTSKGCELYINHQKI